MELLRIDAAAEYVIDEDRPTLDGPYIRNILILGRESKNAFNSSRTASGDALAPRRRFNLIVDSAEEVAKFADRPAFILHKPAPRDDADLLGAFENPRSTPKGIRADLKCRQIDGSEEYVPQCVALRDNVEHARPFGGFSPTFDFLVSPDDGEVQKILACESVDLVAQPASVKSAVESEAEEEKEPEYVEKAEHEALKGDHERLRTEHGALEERVKGIECALAAAKVSGSEQRSAPLPVVRVETKATSFAEFVRS